MQDAQGVDARVSSRWLQCVESLPSLVKGRLQLGDAALVLATDLGADLFDATDPALGRRGPGRGVGGGLAGAVDTVRRRDDGHRSTDVGDDGDLLVQGGEADELREAGPGLGQGEFEPPVGQRDGGLCHMCMMAPGYDIFVDVVIKMGRLELPGRSMASV